MKIVWKGIALLGLTAVCTVMFAGCGNSGGKPVTNSAAASASDEPDWKGRLDKMEALMKDYAATKQAAESGDEDAKAKCGQMESELRGMEMELGYIAPQLSEESKAQFKERYDKIMSIAEIPEMSYGE
ncbi:MAG: hypothetical protein A2Y33_08065 [Spirochaetes bacterium GWF1_51_8]|nr:MAG: hypothetical protein A2Y33_08065 [Spirochaetes bacterium GWF1_51_8]